jgi:hypothetical protein
MSTGQEAHRMRVLPVLALLELNLTTMSRQLETTLSEAAAKNLTVASTLEMADRHGVGIASQPRRRTPFQMLALTSTAPRLCRSSPRPLVFCLRAGPRA